ncbi:MAG: beta-lactamase family protein [Cyclobacteriaceae bacterium]|nr:beta-lactamase family protein [Cyclobacteriaceae bacterium]
MKKLLFFLSVVLSLQLPAQSLRDTTDLESFMDGLLTAVLKEKNIAGATLAVIVDGKVTLTKGYGFADIDKQIPVDPKTTLFRIGSITKLFVWTAVMQQVALGKLNLEADINTYLKDFKIPDEFDQPITLKHLMTHTPGFEDRVIGLFAKDSTKLLPLGTILKKELPDRVRPPFTHASYSNHGTGIAAYIVEQVTGMSFNDYAEKFILEPLSMKHTTLRQPVPALLRKDLSKGYAFKNSLIEKNFEYVPLYPVGAASASAADMTHLMLAYLNNGAYGDFTLLDSTTFSIMKSEVKRHHPAVNPMRYGFMDLSQNGVTAIGHGGDTFWFHSLLAILPDHNAGLFISFNTDTGGGTYINVFEAFMDRYFPDTTALQPVMPVTKEWLDKFSGEYRMNRYTQSDITKIASLFSIARVEVKDSTKLAVTLPDKTEYYVPVDSSTFRKEFSNDRIGMAYDERGKVVFAFDGLLSIFVLEKVSGLESSAFHNNLLIFLITLTLVTVFYWPMIAIIRKRYLPGPMAKTTLPMVIKSVAWLHYFLFLLFFIGVLIALADPLEIAFGVPGLLKATLVLPIFMIVTTFGMLVMLIPVLRSNRFRVRSRLYYLILSLSGIASLWFLNYWNFLGFKF